MVGVTAVIAVTASAYCTSVMQGCAAFRRPASPLCPSRKAGNSRKPRNTPPRRTFPMPAVQYIFRDSRDFRLVQAPSVRQASPYGNAFRPRQYVVGPRNFEVPHNLPRHQFRSSLGRIQNLAFVFSNFVLTTSSPQLGDPCDPTPQTPSTPSSIYEKNSHKHPSFIPRLSGRDRLLNRV